MGNSKMREPGKLVKFPVAVLLVFLFVFSVAASGTAAERKAEKKEAVVLMPMRATKDIPWDEMTQYEAALVKSLSGKYVVYSGQRVLEKVNDVYKKRSGEAQAGKECDETKCLQDIAIAFQTELVAVANIRKSGGGYSISLAINDVAEDKSVFSEQKSCKGCDEFEVADVLKTIAGGSAPQAQAAAPAPAKAAPSAPEGMVYVKKGDGGFFMDKTEVTQEAYQRVIGSNPSDFKGCPTCPVEQVSWDEAVVYCSNVGKRLPTEQDWEFAAMSGGKGETYAGTSNESEVGDYAWYVRNSGGIFFGKTYPVGGKKPNGLGLYDMSGNVWEWTDSWYDDSKKSRVLRGGSWNAGAGNLRAAERNGSSNRDYAYGFRCSQY